MTERLMVSIQEFSRRLSSIPEAQFTHENVFQFLEECPVDVSTMHPYLYFTDGHYARNLIHKTPLFELVAICWDIGQKSPIHNHRDQKCWMTMAYGKLHIHNFSVVRKDSSAGFCELKSEGQIVLDVGHPTEVDPQQPIHQVLNVPSFNCPAVSLHIYSLPFDSCEVYDLKEKSYTDVKMVNCSEFGELKPGYEARRLALASG